MLRAAGKLFLIGLMILWAAGVTMAAPVQQSGAFLPAIVDFTTDTTSVAYADVEAGKAEATVSWHTINANGQYRVVLEAYYRNTWTSLIGSGETLPLNGSKTVSLPVPENFGPPTLRLTLKTAAGATIEQRFVTIAYYTPSDAPAPSIATFQTGAKGIDTNLLVQSNARVTVSWEIENRQPDTLIRIDQVLADGSAVSAEGPRRALWLPSKGSATLIPRSSSSHDDLHFRLSLVNVQDGTVFDQKDITLPVTGQILIAVPQTTTQQTASVQRRNGISAFNAQTASGNVIVNWDASGADSVQLLQTVDQDGPVSLYIQLPPTGSMVMPAPEDASGVTYELRAQNADGSVATGEVSVSTGDTGNAGDAGSGNGG